MEFGWQRLNAEYAKQFGIEASSWPPRAHNPEHAGEPMSAFDDFVNYTYPA